MRLPIVGLAIVGEAGGRSDFVVRWRGLLVGGGGVESMQQPLRRFSACHRSGAMIVEWEFPMDIRCTHICQSIGLMHVHSDAFATCWDLDPLRETQNVSWTPTIRPELCAEGSCRVIRTNKVLHGASG